MPQPKDDSDLQIWAESFRRATRNPTLRARVKGITERDQAKRAAVMAERRQPETAG